ncbi:MAG: DEAD/DEAH box helicase [Candidatus Neomarinimicrobiota bacterium]
MENFKQTNLDDNILKAVTEMGFEKPTSVQAKTIPHLLNSNTDLIATAQTGTGKTAAFGLPSIHLTDLKNRDTSTLVLCPTRELCIQIAKDLTKYSKYVDGLSILAVYGGSDIRGQIKALNKGVHIVIGTPGRTKDLIKRNKLKIGSIARIVLDEADEMLTMGFKDDLEMILSHTPKDKQTLLFSATMPQKVIGITKSYMQSPERISAQRVNIGAENIKHIYYTVNAKDRYEVIKRISDINPNIYGIVFCRTRRETKDVAYKLMNDGYNADTLNGDLSQAERDEVMMRFRKRKIQLLVATDVAARGLDVESLTHIINYNLPDDFEIYVHRSGRTGRAGNAGVSIAIVHSREIRRIREIEKRSGIEFSKEDVPSGMDVCKTRLYNLIDTVENVQVDEKQIAQFLPDIYKKFENMERDELIKHFVSAEFNRYLSYYKNARDLNVSGRSNDRGKSRGKSGSRERGRSRGRDRKNHGRSNERSQSTSKFSGFYINAGSERKMNPGRLMGLINESLDSSSADIGNIEIMKSSSFFEIEEKYADDIAKKLKGKPFGGTSLEIEKDKGTGKRGNVNKRKKRRKSRKKNKWPQSNNRSRRR